jgi:DNA polymerase-4
MERSVVLAVSPEARQEGIYRGMLLRQALRQCRRLTVIPPNEPLYSRAMQAMLKIISRYTPLIEPVNYGHAYLDVTGVSRLFGVPVDMALKIQREIRQRLTLPTSLGVASNKLVSKIAAEITRPDSIEQVAQGTEKKFVAPLKIYHLPLISTAVKKQLVELNVEIIRQLAELPLSHLTMVFGKVGWRLHQAARGIDYTPVFPPQQLPNFYEQITLVEETNDIVQIQEALLELVERVGRQLRKSSLTARKFILEIYYADHREAAGQKRLPAATNLDHELYISAKELLSKILTRRVKVRRLAVRFFQLRPVSNQLSLFDDQKKILSEIRLNRAVDEIRGKFGSEMVRVGH